MPGKQPYFSCSASTGRVILLDGDPIPPVDPLGANLEQEECAEDQGGLPDLALPPPPASPFITSTTAQSRTQIFCAANDGALLDVDNLPEDNPATPTVDETELCDAGVSAFEQHVVSTADGTDTTIHLGSGAQALTIRLQLSNSFAQARCGPGNVPVISSDSQVLGLSIGVGPTQTPFPAPLITGDPNQVIDVLGIVKITLNELIASAGSPAPTTTDGVQSHTYPDNATDGKVTRRAVHIELPGGDEPLKGSVADVVFGESIADFHGDVCPEGTIVVKKQTAPDEDPETTNFSFTSPGLSPASFNLQDDGTRTFADVTAGTYQITEGAGPSPYSLAAIECLEGDDTTETLTDLGTRRATIKVSPGETVNCTFINVKPGPPPPGQVLCPPNTVPNAMGQCIIQTASCPPGSTQNAAGSCVITRVQCPEGTLFDPITVACIERALGGTTVPINDQLRNLFRGSPCIGPGFGPLIAILGTNGPDRITGTNRSDRIFALGGNDRVSGGRGDDCIEGGSGRDVLDGSNGNDFLLGGTGNDRVSGGPGRDRFSGSSGRDVMSGDTGNDTMRGASGKDRLNGGYGNDRLFGGSGNDGLHTGNGRDRVFAGSGNDIINAGTRGPAAFVDCGSGRNDRVRINRNEVGRTRGCEFVDIFRRFRSRDRAISPR